MSFKVFFSVTGLLVTLMTVSTGYFFAESARLEAKVEKAKQDCAERTLAVDKHFDEHVQELNKNSEGITIKLAEIQTDIVWIRRALNNEIQTRSPRGRSFDK